MDLLMEWWRVFSYGVILVNLVRKELYLLEEPQRKIFSELIHYADLEGKRSEVFAGIQRAAAMRLVQYSDSRFYFLGFLLFFFFLFSVKNGYFRSVFKAENDTTTVF